MQALHGSGRPHEHVQAHVDVARAYVGEAALASAEAHLERALACCAAIPGVDGCVDLRCELAELAALSAERDERAARGQGRAARGRARGHASAAAALAAQVSDPSWEIRVLLRISDVFDRCGNHDEAAELQTRAMRLIAHEFDQALLGITRLMAAA